MRKILAYIAVIFACLSSYVFAATQSYVKQWDSAVIIGSIANTKYRYYLEPQLRLIADPYVLNQLYLLGGLGYQVTPNLMLFTGPGWILSKSPQGKISHEVRLWQQANWRVIRTDTYNVNSRTRLEERKNTQYTQIAYRFRERVWLHIPFKRNPKYSFSCFDEIFFNLNHPSWTSPYFFEQNRAFIGIGNQLTKSLSVDMGYMNQYIRSNQSRVDHILLVVFNVLTI